MGISKKKIEEEATKYQKSKTFQKFTKKTPKLHKELLSTNLRDPEHLKVIFQYMKEAGWLPEKYKNPYQFQKVISAVYNRRIAKEKKKLDALDDNAKLRKMNEIKRNILDGITKKELTRKFEAAEGKDWFKNPLLRERVENAKYRALPIKVGKEGLIYDARRFSDKVLKPVIDFANTHEIPDLLDGKEQFDADGNKIMKKAFAEGSGDAWAKGARAEWKKWGEINRALKAKYGVDFDIGHFIPSALGGPNVGANAATELTWNRLNALGEFVAGNRPKGKLPGLKTSQIANELHVPESYLQDFLNKQVGITGTGISDVEELARPSAGAMQKVTLADNKPIDITKIGGTEKQIEGMGDIIPTTEQSRAADQLAASQRQKADDFKQLFAKVEDYKTKGIIPPETTVIGDGTTNPQIKSLNDLNKYGKIQSDFEVINGKVVKSTKPTTKGIIQNIKRGGQTIFETTVNNKKVQQAITTGSKVIEAIPAPIKKAAVVLPVLGAIGDTGVIAGTFYDNKETKQQQRINEIKGASGALGLAGFKFPPLWIPSTFMWGVGEMAQWQYNKKKARYKESYQDLYYMEAAAEGMVDAEGKPLDEFINQKVNRQIDADRKTRVGRFKR